MEEAKDKIHITGKMIAVVFILLLLVVGTFGMFLLNASHDGPNSAAAQSSSTGDIPEKCRLPSGQDVNSWKEHLGHHAETQDCLKYFN
ncbi:hypothetical protein J4233_02935 [Candidatus Pacearchaeota archaeon]|nr:hypothetical protein [Candidatus Pacearchaeota archaeon]